ncbi:DUF2786 domain-containing protein [Laribacter hongkongensis]|uniref:DUF2786 domain-containing protein n=1 Tax=Laribacter hongkongensis TaxID=168471 RepID=UPI001EFEA050|nr:DUF2786 domain-containing protein [Laribacter hongkongensis]MCG8991481.1 DUF2786 domain-containing protein [Laribacter hongkongensis]MCG8997737.1 DUF2786 domain-containing protein [Laribacter hongkongensis]MCG9001237.1 DUF2786 domain-containing protein [Laribacter hongkongensis]MCG9003067.1 DUF2786 domain-containing protein [Laribacter hongkongensis]MCG9007445.1 DUF2786 domain-containing protein [Laribacter hongkongensis]
MDKQTAIEKIRKCLALAKSANEHEAAAALRQAQALMRKYGVQDGDILMAEVSEAKVKAGAKTKPVKWESQLSTTVADAFGCRKIFVQEWKAGYWTFIGCGPAAEVATYAYTVLMRQLRKARGEFQQTHCKRLVPASKTRRADLFCEAWVAAVRRQIEAFAGTPANAEALEVYMAKEYPNLGTLVPRDRQEGKNLRDGDVNARAAGWHAGRQAQLNHGVNNKPLALGS